MLVSGGNSVCFSLKLVGVLVGAFGALLFVYIELLLYTFVICGDESIGALLRNMFLINSGQAWDSRQKLIEADDVCVQYKVRCASRDFFP